MMETLHWLATILREHYEIPLGFLCLILSILALSYKISDTISKLEKDKKDDRTKSSN